MIIAINLIAFLMLNVIVFQKMQLIHNLLHNLLIIPVHAVLLQKLLMAMRMEITLIAVFLKLFKYILII